MKEKYLDVDKVWYTDKENVEEEKEANYIVRNIESISDYLRGIINILSDYYLVKRWDLKILKYENLFSYPNGTSLDELLQKGIFFRGESKKYENQIPGLYRDIKYVQHENEIIIDGMLNAADQLEGKSLFDTLTLLQHYGSNTRILDMTSNALVALYFATSTNLNEDGFVYLLSGSQLGNKDIEKIKSPIDRSVIVKDCLSRLTFDDKRILSNLLSNIPQIEKIKDIKEYLIQEQSQSVLKKNKRIITRLYSLVQKELGVSNIEIPIYELFGYDIVRPFSLDERVIRQSGLFMIIGLENISKIDKKYELALKKNKKLIDLKTKLVEIQEKSHKEINEIPKLEYEIDRYKKFVYKKILERTIQSEATHNIYDLSVKYSPIISGLTGEHPARILIKKEYKKRILNELNMLGITSSSIYPDLAHKTKDINKKYNFIELPR
ncbi:FRG domain-containing protein [Lactobacillus taiwanensis]|uniref:FRG domain-containing protein n=1 Tax=Lactobacillus taiwanensis TaxID=508451 RepID=UPI000B9975A9|nr:FRG domain-containing protein [Lactobacillus taiwanensis]OYS31899.1 hypothetical protein CBF75_05530 [Lactobacillus taiwanensis]